ncbi:hypothetical protein GCM10009647_090530 [Streptomyces sanglieri]
MKPTDAEITVPDDTNLTEAIILRIAEQKDVSPFEMPPLYETINPVALNELFQEQQSGRLSFEYAGYEVVVHGRKRVTIHKTDPPIRQEQTAKSDDESILRLTCTVCDWEATAEENETTDVSRRAIDHFVSTDHTPVRKTGEISI